MPHNKTLDIPGNFNYISVFLTWACNMKCPYCINNYRGKPHSKQLTGEEWVRGLCKLNGVSNDKPITISGGEPTLHPEFYEIIRYLRQYYSLDLLTNLEVDIKEFTRQISPIVFMRKAPYASLRVSYHPGVHDMVSLLAKVYHLKESGYEIGVWAVDEPFYYSHTRAAQDIADKLGIDFRIKEYLNREHGTYMRPDALDIGNVRSCECKTTELLIAPNGNIHRCHADMYEGINALGNILDESMPELGNWMPCSRFGLCNPCDWKIKFDRYQVMGHCSVEVRNV